MEKVMGKCRVSMICESCARHAKIKPDGFWSEMVEVWQTRDILTNKLKEPEIGWSSGGKDGSRTDLDATANFIEALGYAMDIAKEWKWK
jgi:hypothetical protein